MMETEYVLTVWLKIVPDHAVNFVRLAIVASLVNIIGKTGYTASMATGTIRRYVLWVTTVGCLAFPITWLVFYLGTPSEATYIVFIVVYVAVEATRLWVMKDLLGFPVLKFCREVIVRILVVTIVSLPLPLLSVCLLPSSLSRVTITIVLSVLSTFLSIYWVGMTSDERIFVSGYIKNKLRH